MKNSSHFQINTLVERRKAFVPPTLPVSGSVVLDPPAEMLAWHTKKQIDARCLFEIIFTKNVIPSFGVR